MTGSTIGLRKISEIGNQQLILQNNSSLQNHLTLQTKEFHLIYDTFTEYVNIDVKVTNDIIFSSYIQLIIFIYRI